jgi:hypothetical protein
MANKKIRKLIQTPTEALRLLWSEGFFKGWQDWAAIEKDLNSRGFNFTSGDLGKALSRAKHLTRRGKVKKYEYIQKYPFVEEDGDEQ